MSDSLSIAVSGLIAARQSLSTISHNIANSSREGYSRQRVELGARPPELSGAGYFGTGVLTQDITRVYDQFQARNVRDGTTSFNQFDTFFDFAAQIDNILADPQVGVVPVLDDFFDAVQAVADDPTSVAARTAMLGEAGSMISRFDFLYQRLTDIGQSINTEIKSVTTEINGIASAIGNLNEQMLLSGSNGKQANDLLDQRDILVQDLSKLVAVRTFEQADGSLNVFVGNGQPLVVGPLSQVLTTVNSAADPTRLEIAFVQGSTPIEISSLLSGGKIGGLLDYRNQLLEPAINGLGRVAIGLADSFNDQHKLGQDLNGSLGSNFFKVASPQVLVNANNTGTATVAGSIVNVDDLTNSDYALTYNGGNAYTLTRLSDNTTTAISTGGASPFVTEEIDGFSLTITGTVGAVVGDRYLIQPTRAGARDIGALITDPEDIAAAAPIRTVNTFANTGDGVISSGTVNSPNNQVTITFTAPAVFDVVDNTTGATLATGLAYGGGPQNVSFNGWTVTLNGAPNAGDTFSIDQVVTTPGASNGGSGTIGAATVSTAGSDPDLRDPVTITFNNPPTTYTVTGSTTGSPTAGITYTAGQPISFNGWTVDISGTPAVGDTFTIGPNTNGVSDNRNALILAGLQNARTLGNGTASYSDTYGELVADVGTRTRQAEISTESQRVLLNQAITAREATSGVNLDEEAANLVKFQQLFQANAQVIATANSLFQEIIAAVRG